MGQVTLDNMQALLNEALKPINEKLSVLEYTINQTSESLSKLSAQTDIIDRLNVQVNIQANDVGIMKSQIKSLQDHILSLETHSRRNNLQFIGIPEKKGENCEKLVLDICDRIGIGFDDRTIERAHRLGKFQEDRVRSVIVKFNHYKDRQKVWTAKSDINIQSHVRIIEDFPLPIVAKRRQLSPICEAAFKYRDTFQPTFRHKAWLAVDKLILDGKSYTVDTLHLLPEHLLPKNVFTPSNASAVAFFTKWSPMSNHFISEMQVRGQNYNCMEQYIMHSKATMFDDTDTAAKIMREMSPPEQKYLGKKVAGFDSARWEDDLEAVLMQGLKAKFIQCTDCRDFLKATGTKRIGEATRDTLYGTGHSLRSPHVLDPSRWDTRGNMMGKCLEAVRGEL